MNAPHYYLVTTPEVSLTFIGSAETDDAFTWLFTPGGERVLRVRKEYVRETTLEETASESLTTGGRPVPKGTET